MYHHLSCRVGTRLKLTYNEDEFNATAAETGCTDRFGSTTSTVRPSDRDLRGCAELQELRGGAVGMPQNLMVSGAYYFEVWVRSGEEVRLIDPKKCCATCQLCPQVAGFVDSAWAGLEEHQWLSSSTGSNPGHIGIAVRFLAEELAEVRFSWDGTWKNPQQIQFSQYLIPVVFALESSWRIPADAWLFLAPSIFYQPLTQREFPRLCAFPLDFEMMAQPPALCSQHGDAICCKLPDATNEAKRKS
eukprot:g5325.t1